MKRAPIYRRGQTWYSTETRRSLGTKDRAAALKLERASRRSAKETAAPPLGDAGGGSDSPGAPVPGLRATEAALPTPAAVDSLSPVAGASPVKPEGDPLAEVGADPSPPPAPGAPPLAPEVQEIADQLGLKDVMTPEEVKEVTALVSPAVVGLVVKLTGVAAGWMRTTPRPPPSERSLALLTKMVDIKVGRALANAQLSENVVLGVAVVVVFAEQAFGDSPKPPEPALH